MSYAEKINYVKNFDGITSVTETNNTLIAGTRSPEQFSKYYEEPIVTFKTIFDDKEYDVKICDERLLYSSLFAWRDLRLTSLFQGDHTIIYDGSYGKMELAERENYLYTLKVAKVLLGKGNYHVNELYDVINKMINYKEFKMFSPKEENKLSEEFFNEVYVPLVSCTGDVSGYPRDIMEFNNGRPIITSAQKVLKKYYKNK